MNEAKQWSIETMPPSPKSSIHSNEYFHDLTEAEGKELTNMFSGMIEKVEVQLQLPMYIFYEFLEV